jgi:transposase
MRRSRYHGKNKTHFQNVLWVTAIKVVRILTWFEERPLAKTRTSHFAALVA